MCGGAIIVVVEFKKLALKRKETIKKNYQSIPSNGSWWIWVFMLVAVCIILVVEHESINESTIYGRDMQKNDFFRSRVLK